MVVIGGKRINHTYIILYKEQITQSRKCQLRFLDVCHTLIYQNSKQHYLYLISPKLIWLLIEAHFEKSHSRETAGFASVQVVAQPYEMYKI